MALKLIKAESPEEIEQFIRLPWKIYKDQPQWVPPLLSERRKFLDPDINPFFEFAEVDLYLAFSNDGEPVGRIALILNNLHNDFHAEKTGFFGMFESINDQNVADLLFEICVDWCKEKGMDRFLGPVNLSTNHECGLLVEGFDRTPMLGMPYNPAYYQDLFDKWGLVKTKDLLSFIIPEPRVLPEYLVKGSKKILKRNRFSVRALRMNDLENEMEIIWKVYNAAWERNWAFVPITRGEFDFMVEEMEPIIVPELCLIAEKDGEPVGFSLSLPDINQALKRVNGSLFPFGWLKFLWDKRKINSYRTLTLGIMKKYHRLGIDIIFYQKTLQWYIDHKVAFCDQSWVLEDNLSMVIPIQRIGGEVYKCHRLYERTCIN